MWENENETMQPKQYLYPPVAPSLSRGYQQDSSYNNQSNTRFQQEKAEYKKQDPPILQQTPSSQVLEKTTQNEGKESGEDADINYLFLAQIVVCIAVIGFVLLMKKTNTDFYLQMGEQYKSALEQGVEISGQHDLIKFTEDAVAQVREAAQKIIEKSDSPKTKQSEGAGGWNPTSKQEIPPAGFSLTNYTLKDKPILPLKDFIVTSEYGFRKHPITGEFDFHGGLDLAAPQGTPIQAVLSGIVLQAGTSESYGNYARVLHKNNLVSTYNHMESISVTQGQNIQQGDPIGTVGSTGVSTGPHLHLEFLLNGIRVNPALSLEIPK